MGGKTVGRRSLAAENGAFPAPGSLRKPRPKSPRPQGRVAPGGRCGSARWAPARRRPAGARSQGSLPGGAGGQGPGALRRRARRPRRERARRSPATRTPTDSQARRTLRPGPYSRRDLKVMDAVPDLGRRAPAHPPRATDPRHQRTPQHLEPVTPLSRLCHGSTVDDGRLIGARRGPRTVSASDPSRLRDSCRARRRTIAERHRLEDAAGCSRVPAGTANARGSLVCMPRTTLVTGVSSRRAIANPIPRRLLTPVTNVVRGMQTRLPRAFAAPAEYLSTRSSLDPVPLTEHSVTQSQRRARSRADVG